MVTPVTAVEITPFEWASQHVHLIAWPTIVYFAWQARGALAKFMEQMKSTADKTEENLKISKLMQADLQVIDSNHLSHIEKDMSELNTKYDRSTEILQSIDKGIGILVDRG